MLAYARPALADLNWERIAAFGVLFVIALFAMIDPAFAQNSAFGEFEDRIKTQTSAATNVATNILYIAAGLSLLIGVAPMLWGQVKVKWIVTCLAAAVVFGLIPIMINAFAGAAVVPTN